MSNYVFAYHDFGKDFGSPEENAKHMSKWQTWLEDLGDAVVNPGTPLGVLKTVNSNGVTSDTGSNRLTGFTVVKADSMDAALEMVKRCPYLEIGTIEVAEQMVM